MPNEFQTVLIVLYVILGLDVLLIIASLSNKLRHKIDEIRKQKIGDLARKYFGGDEFPHHLKSRKAPLDIYIEFREAYSVDQKIQNEVNRYVGKRRIDAIYARRLNSPLKNRRIQAAVYLGYMDTEIAASALVNWFKKEKKHNIKVFAAHALCLQGNSAAIPSMIESLVGAPRWYIDKIQPMLFEFGKSFYDYVPGLYDRKEPEIVELLIKFGKVFIVEDLKQYLLEKSRSSDVRLQVMALDALSVHYPEELKREQILASNEVEIIKLLIKALSFDRTPQNVDAILGYTRVPDIEEHIVYGISVMARSEPRLLNYLLGLFHGAQDERIKIITAKVLSNRIEYFLLKITTSEKEAIKDLIRELLHLNMMSEIIGFLNKNKDREIENEIVDVIRGILPNQTNLRREFGLYLKDRILKKLSLEKTVIEKKPREQKREKAKIRFLATLLVFVVSAIPIAFMLRRYDMFSVVPPLEVIKRFVLDFSYLLVFYSVAINFIYIAILIPSFIGSSVQAKLWKLKKPSFLFREGILPSISIIAPAYSEEASIIESTSSLLNLKYPDYELIVVNDGSPDDTLNTLINYYGLEKYDIFFDRFLDTKPIRGIYINKNIPKLLVVDKENGGKADSLNAGINLSRKDYFCGIDADSLLEPEALLKATSLMLDSEREMAAVGGNIFPVNGCSVDKGALTKIRIPKHFVALGQTIEYLRAFMAGRIGWAYMKALLIISGAFGIFNKKRIHEIGGYLTESGKYHKDTVGEDMELVVRLSRHLYERKVKHVINYSFNANCWTEVPESYKILHSQRDRWHRGLLDIVSFHRKLIFNPAFGVVGLVAMPYYFIFEMIGPLIEFQGYIMVFVGALLGMLNPFIALLLFISTIMLGVLVSVSALLIAEKNVNYFSVKEFFVLLGFAIFENFGLRQLISFWRVIGYFSALKKPKGWGKMVRKGFSSS